MGPGFYKDAAPTALDTRFRHFVLRWQAERDTAFVRTKGFRTFGAAPRARERRRRWALPAQYKPGVPPLRWVGKDSPPIHFPPMPERDQPQLIGLNLKFVNNAVIPHP